MHGERIIEIATRRGKGNFWKGPASVGPGPRAFGDPDSVVRRAKRAISDCAGGGARLDNIVVFAGMSE
ncbi:MAG: hypothetical protein M3454_01055, partial [Actinomycetota bacterium]|nr:hypothetical protein [Actinomycetota bacterium]